MKWTMVSVFDRAVQSFNRPFCVRAVGEAMRSFRDEVNNAQGEMFKHPSDYELYGVGLFDDETGMVEEAGITPTLIVRGEDCKEKV